MAERAQRPVAAVDVDRMAARLARLPAQRRALRAAIGEFGADFELAAWTAAFESSDTRDINRVLAVTGGYAALVTNTIEAARIGARAVGIAPTRGMSSASGLLDAISRDGGPSVRQAETFMELYRTRNALQHASPDVQADEVHRQVKLLLRHLPGFVKSFAAWLARRGVDLRTG